MNSETAWLIEHPHDPRYGRESWYGGKDGFTIDSLQAVRYARQEDAEREIDRFPISLAKHLRAEHHAWIPAPSRCSTCDENKIEANDLRTRLNHLRDSWRLIGESLREFGHDPKSEDRWVSMVHNALVELDLLRRAGKERDDQTNHAIRVNREEAGQAGYDRALQDIGYTVSVGMIAAERRRQVEGESWTSAHDDGHDAGEIALAAACYAIDSAGRGSVEYRLGHSGGIEINLDAVGLYWPFERNWWKPGNPIRSLVKAGALIAAEIDRRLRAGEEP